MSIFIKKVPTGDNTPIVEVSDRHTVREVSPKYETIRRKRKGKLQRSVSQRCVSSGTKLLTFVKSRVLRPNERDSKRES